MGEITLRVASNIALLRAHRGISLETLAAALDDLGRPLNPSSLSKLERGLRRIDLDDLAALARAFDVSDTQLMTTDTNWLLGRGFTAEVEADESLLQGRIDEFERLQAFEERVLKVVRDLPRDGDRGHH